MAIRAAVVLLVGMLMMSGCSRRQPPSPPAPGIAVLSFEHVAPDRLPPELRAWFDENKNAPGAHVTRLDGKAYVLVAWGEKPTGGYAIRVEDVLSRAGQQAVVLVSLSAPGPGQAVTEALTHPFDLVAVDRLPRQVTFAYMGEAVLRKPGPAPAAPSPPPPQESRADGRFQVVQPLFGSIIDSPVRIAGRAAVFEGRFDIEIEDGHNVLAKRQVAGKEAAPGWWDFDVTVPFDRPTSPFGAIIFVTYNPKDGSRQEHLIVPVSFRTGHD